MPTAEIDAAVARMSDLEEELRDLIVLVTRLAADNHKRTSLDELLTRYDVTREDLAALPDEE